MTLDGLELGRGVTEASLSTAVERIYEERRPATQYTIDKDRFISQIRGRDEMQRPAKDSVEMLLAFRPLTFGSDAHWSPPSFRHQIRGACRGLLTGARPRSGLS